VQAGVRSFVTDCYGAAADRILDYIQTINDGSSYARGYFAAARTEADYGPNDQRHAIYGGNLLLKRDVIERLDALFDEAERAAADDPELLRRVRYVRLSLQLHLLYYSEADDPLRVKAMRGFFPVAKQAGVGKVYVQKKDALMTLDEFEEFCKGE